MATLSVKRIFSRWFLFNNRWVNFIWISAIASAMAYQTWLGWHYNSNDTTNVYLVTARICAYNLLIGMVILWLPVLRHAMSLLQATKLRVIYPIQLAKSIHKWLGHGLMAFALVHGSFYLLYMDSLEGDFAPILFGTEADLVRSMKTTMYEFVSEDESIDDVQLWIDNGRTVEGYETVVKPLMKEDCTKCHSSNSTQTYAYPELPLTTYEGVVKLSYSGVMSRQFQINVSGLVMFVSFLLMWITSLAIMRKKKYHWFQQIHRLGYLVAILAFLHIPRIEYCLAPGVLLLLEFLLNRTIKYWGRCQAQIQPLGDRHVMMKIKLPKTIKIPAGQYCQVRLAETHDKDWHSISIANSAEKSNEIYLVIKDLGDWSNRLVALSFVRQNLEVDVRGFYASPMADAAKVEEVVCFVGGIGVTPALSLLETMKNKANAQLKLVWTFQDWHLFQAMADEFLEAAKSMSNVSIHCYATRPQPEGFQYSGGLQVNHGRPEVAGYISNVNNHSRFKRRYAFVCGPQGLVNSVKRSIQSQSNWRLKVEHF